MLITSNSSGARPCSDVSRFHDSLCSSLLTTTHRTSNCSRYNEHPSINRKLHAIVERTVVGEPYRGGTTSVNHVTRKQWQTDVTNYFSSYLASFPSISPKTSHVLVSRSSDGSRLSCGTYLCVEEIIRRSKKRRKKRTRAERKENSRWCLKVREIGTYRRRKIPSRFHRNSMKNDNCKIERGTYQEMKGE